MVPRSNSRRFSGFFALLRGVPSRLLAATGAAVVAVSLTSCATTGPRADIVVSAADQKMAVIDNGTLVCEYNISTSKFGLGDQRGSYLTPTGRMVVAKKIGNRLPEGAVLKSRRATGEVLKPNSPGRDPIVTRILWLKGTESRNSNAYGRCIYIHGTPEERTIGSPSSYGCIRMKSRDMVDLYERIGVGSNVYVMTSPMTSPSSGRTARFGSPAGGSGPPSGREIMDRAIASTGSLTPTCLREEQAKEEAEAKAKTKAEEPVMVVKKAEVIEPEVMRTLNEIPIEQPRKSRSLLDPFGILSFGEGRKTSKTKKNAARPVVEIEAPAKVGSI